MITLNLTTQEVEFLEMVLDTYVNSLMNSGKHEPIDTEALGSSVLSATWIQQKMWEAINVEGQD